jgi:uncharacterized coiled-coil DUF342 family protein
VSELDELRKERDELKAEVARLNSEADYYSKRYDYYYDKQLKYKAALERIADLPEGECSMPEHVFVSVFALKVLQGS